METLIIYELKVAMSIAVFYAFYRLLLSKETLHRLNRVVLIATAVLSFVLPFCVITIHKTVNIPLGSEGIDLSTAGAASDMAAQAAAEWWWIALTALFAAGVVACLLKVLVSVLGVWRLIKSGELLYEPDGSKVIIVDRNIAPCSWMEWIIISRDDYESNCREIINHEKAHIELGHSKDVLVVDVLTAFQWFNPMMWMLRADLRAIHEFEADDAVLRQGTSIKDYLHLLIKKAISESGYSVTNSFNHSILKNRITMMSKSRTQLRKGLKVLYVIPLICASLAVNAEEKTTYALSDGDKDSENVIKIKQKDTTIKSNVTVISVGSIKKISPEEIESMQVYKGKEAVDKFGEKAANGAIVVKLKNGEESVCFMEKADNLNDHDIVMYDKKEGDLKTISIGGSSDMYVKRSSLDNIMYIVDGKLADEGCMKEILPEEIQCISVIKDEKIKDYVLKFDYKEPVKGVVVIELKK